MDPWKSLVGRPSWTAQLLNDRFREKVFQKLRGEESRLTLDINVWPPHTRTQIYTAPHKHTQHSLHTQKLAIQGLFKFKRYSYTHLHTKNKELQEGTGPALVLRLWDAAAVSQKKIWERSHWFVDTRQIYFSTWVCFHLNTYTSLAKRMHYSPFDNA